MEGSVPSVPNRTSSTARVVRRGRTRPSSSTSSAGTASTKPGFDHEVGRRGHVGACVEEVERLAVRNGFRFLIELPTSAPGACRHTTPVAGPSATSAAIATMRCVEEPSGFPPAGRTRGGSARREGGAALGGRAPDLRMTSRRRSCAVALRGTGHASLAGALRCLGAGSWHWLSPTPRAVAARSAGIHPGCSGSSGHASITMDLYSACTPTRWTCRRRAGPLRPGRWWRGRVLSGGGC